MFLFHSVWEHILDPKIMILMVNPTLSFRHNEFVGMFCQAIILYSFLFLYIYLFILLFIYLFIHLFINLFIYLFIYLYIYLYIYLSIYLFISCFLSVDLPTSSSLLIWCIRFILSFTPLNLFFFHTSSVGYVKVGNKGGDSYTASVVTIPSV